MKISFCIPIFNKELYLNECLVTVMSQTHTNFEVILVDDASTDGTQEICEYYANKDKRVKYRRNAFNRGVGYTRNLARDMATGDIILVQDADDMSFKDRAERVVKFFKAYPKTDIMYGSCLTIDWNNRQLSLNQSQDFNISKLKKDNYISHPTVAYRKRVDIKYRNVKYIDDWYFYLDCFKAGYKFGVTKDVLSTYRLTYEGLTLAGGYLTPDKVKARKKIIKEFDDLEVDLDHVLKTSPVQKVRIKKILKEIPRKSCVLDIGCNAGYIMQRIEKKGCCVTGVEKSNYLCDIAQRKGLSVHPGMPNGDYDVVLLCDILEHYGKNDARKLVHAALNRLWKGGKLIITVPYKHGTFSTSYVKEHVADYTEEDLKEFVNGHDIKISPIFHSISAVPEWLMGVVIT